MHMGSFMRRLIASLLIATGVVACATSPLGRHQLKFVSDQEVAAAGVQSFATLKTKEKISKDPQQNRYVQCVAQAITSVIPTMPWNITPPASWEVVVFDSDEVNAFALPGGKIGVYTGLLKVATTQDQLAAVLGHEVSHVLAGHSAERLSDQMIAQGVVSMAQAYGAGGQVASIAANTFFLLPFSRTHETEADLLGMDLMAHAGFDPRAAITLWEEMSQQAGRAPPELLSTHPGNATRIQNLSARLPRDEPIYQQVRAAGRRPDCG